MLRSKPLLGAEVGEQNFGAFALESTRSESAVSVPRKDSSQDPFAESAAIVVERGPVLLRCGSARAIGGVAMVPRLRRVSLCGQSFRGRGKGAHMDRAGGMSFAEELAGLADEISVSDEGIERDEARRKAAKLSPDQWHLLTQE